MNKRNVFLSGKQKAGFFLLLIFALATVSLGFLRLRNNLYSPFSFNQKYVPYEIRDEVNTVERLKFRDTDNDGITDFDELYIYKTSPYIEDTDSDGFYDGKELEKGTDPLCHNEKDCNNELIVSEQYKNTIGVNEKEPEPLVIGGVEIDPNGYNLTEIFSDPENIKNMLIESGVSPNYVAEIDDEQLLMYTQEYLQTAIKGLQAEKELENNYFNIKNDVNLNTSSNLEEGLNYNDETDVEYIKLILKQNGISEEQIDQISEEQIMEYINNNQVE